MEVSKERRTARLAAWASEKEVRKYHTACAKLEMKPATALRQIVRAFVVHAADHDRILLPLRFANSGVIGGAAQVKKSRRGP